MKLCRSRRERVHIKYAIYKSSGDTPTEARHYFGFDNIEVHAVTVEDCLQRAEKIYKDFQDLKKRLCYGLSDEDTSEDDSGSDRDSDVGFQSEVIKLDDHMVIQILSDSDYNWFEVAEKIAVL